MEPSTNPQANFELPTPQSLEEASPSNAPSEGAPAGASPERAAGGERPMGAPQAASQVASAYGMAQTQTVDPVQAAMGVQPVGTAMPTAASDADLIEKEWVEKAKAIVEKTRSDPHLQNREINRFKADYMKKRYDKDIKVTDEQA